MLFVNSGMAAAVGEGFSGKTYPDFAAWAATQGTNQNPSTGLGGFRGLVRVTLGASFNGNMYGSPWGSGPPSYGAVSTDSAANRVALHSFLSRAEADANLSRIVLFQAVNNGSSAFGGQTRNGYASLSYASSEPSFRIERFDYFNDATGLIRRVNPYEQTWSEVDF
jgi:hypothetical protein